MDRKLSKITGIRVEIPQGTGEHVAIDELVDDLLHGDMNGVLHALHEPHKEAEPDPGTAPA